MPVYLPVPTVTQELDRYRTTKSSWHEISLGTCNDKFRKTTRSTRIFPLRSRYLPSNDRFSQALTAEINHLFTVFLQNGYPQVLVSDILFQPITSNVIPTLNSDSGLHTSEEFTVGSLVLPYMREINGPIKAL